MSSDWSDTMVWSDIAVPFVLPSYTMILGYTTQQDQRGEIFEKVQEDLL